MFVGRFDAFIGRLGSFIGRFDTFIGWYDAFIGRLRTVIGRHASFDGLSTANSLTYAEIITEGHSNRERQDQKILVKNPNDVS
uniref:hypothetical protein n=1 Tax=uncultured Allobacillus sp. TaxID=1638025 RepID=UPI0025990737|nr:hypothetical protein [uncultured Allobacillus sp.]